MPAFSEFFRRLQILLRRDQFASDLNEEMRLHKQLREEEHRKSGAAPDEAHAAAIRQFGNANSLRERSRDAWGFRWLEHLIQDASYGLRTMTLRTPGLTIVAVLSLALGIGANTAIFSLLNAVMLRTLPVKDPNRLVVFGKDLDCCISDAFPNTTLYSYPFYREMRKRVDRFAVANQPDHSAVARQNNVFSDVAAASSTVQSIHGFVAGRTEAEAMDVLPVSGTYFSTLGVSPIIGRALLEQDDATKDDHPVAVVSYAFWTQSLGRDPSVLNQKLTIGSTVFSIIGVAPRGFFGTELGQQPDVWVPLSMQKEVPPGWNGYDDEMFESLVLMARLKPGVSRAQAESNANLLFQQILRGFPHAPKTRESLQQLEKTHVELTSLANGFSRMHWSFVEVLMAVVALVLLIACANIANLLLARATSRARELSVRHALGAGRARLVRQLFTESLVLALGGGALGIALAAAAKPLLLRMQGSDPLNLDVPIDAHVLLFTLTITFATSILFGVIPALRATRSNIVDSLRDGRNSSARPGGTLAGRALVVSQVALSLILLVGAGLFLRSLINLGNVSTGFDKENVILLRLDPSSAGYKQDIRLAALDRDIQQRIAALPGVRAASFSLFTFNEGTWNNPIWVQGYFAGHKDIDVHHNVVGGDYFAAMGIPLLMGRTFGPQDTFTSPKVGIIGESLARTLFPAGSPLGRRYGRTPDHADIEVIGVVKDVKYNRLDEPQQLGDYLPYTQSFQYLDDFQVRYAGNPANLIRSIRETIHDVDRALPISSVTTLNEQVSASISNQRLVAELSILFGLVAVCLACIGIHGLMSYTVTRRTHEIGLRMALGAERTHVLWQVMREILVLVSAGIAIGVPVSLAGDRWIGSMLFGLGSTDALSFVGAAVLLLAVAALAGYLPARRASLIDPIIALRYE